MSHSSTTFTLKVLRFSNTSKICKHDYQTIQITSVPSRGFLDYVNACQIMLLFPQKYLRTYHYISPTRSGNHDFKTAVRNFQHFMNLPVTGKPDRATLNMMIKPRCGVPDVEDGAFKSISRKRRYSTFGSKWSKTHLTYYLQHGQDVPRATQEWVIERALQYWSEVSPLTFSRIGNPNQADLKMR